MKNLDILGRFLGVGYVEVHRSTRLIDYRLKDLVLLRKTSQGNTVYYLGNGNSVFMPWKWDDLFSSFYIHSGHQVLHNTEPEVSDYFEKFISTITKLHSVTLSCRTDDGGQDYLDLLGELCNLGTTGMIDYLKESYNISLNPFEYRSIAKNIYI